MGWNLAFDWAQCLAVRDDKAVIGTYKLVARKRSLQSLPTFLLDASVSTRRRALPAAKVKPNAP